MKNEQPIKTLGERFCSTVRTTSSAHSRVSLKKFTKYKIINNQEHIPILSKTMIYIPDGIMEAYFMLLNYKTLFQLLFGQGCEIKIFLTEWLECIFSNHEIYIIQQDNDVSSPSPSLHQPGCPSLLGFVQ